MKLFLLLSLAWPAAAATVVNGGSLLSQTHANQIASWLGEGDLVLTNAYSYSGTFTGAGDANAFHAGVDATGRTGIETFTIASGVPEPGTAALAGIALAVADWRRAR